MQSKEYKFFLKDIISLLRANIIDLKEKRNLAGEEEKEYIAARLFSYQEVISSLKAQIKEYNISEEDIGLDEIIDLI